MEESWSSPGGLQQVPGGHATSGAHQGWVTGPDLIEQIWFLLSNFQWYPNNSYSQPSTGAHLEVAPGEAVEGEGVEGDVVGGNADDRRAVQGDREPAKEDGQPGHQVEGHDGEAGGEVGGAGGRVGDALEQVEAAVEQRALLGVEHLEMALAPTGALLEGLAGDLRGFSDDEVLLQAAQRVCERPLVLLCG